ncbi:MAG TPA: 3-keto-5-aminohexanoate cleavage protein [Actinomycetes bacterium]|nr:3-keto-5-aminohexanoate cleavage protein [Actinomycetes bacterium]
MAAPATLITVAPTGAETAKSDAPTLPVTLEELLEQAEACEAAGAAMVHVHIRDADANPTLDLGRLRETVVALRERTGLIVQLSTGGSVHDPYDARLRVLDAEPDSCSLTCGTVNFGDDVFLNPWPFMVELYRATQEREIVPEFELFDLGHVAALQRLLDQEGSPYGGHVHCDLVMGVPGGMPGTAQALVSAVAGLPPGCSFSATGIGRTSLTVALASLAAGGHLRVGMEDTLTFRRGEPVRDNAQLVERAATLATLVQRPPMPLEAARALLGVKDRAAVVGAGRGTPT